MECEAVLESRKLIKSSTGEGSERIIIKVRTQILGGFEWDVLFSLADRAVMKCSLLLGRRALSGNFLVDTQATYMLGCIQDFNKLTNNNPR